VKRRAFLALPIVAAAMPSRGAEGYPAVLPGQILRFPRDHGSHPAYRTEWWYVTGWVRTRDGAPLGVQVTFFRNRPRVAEDNPSNFAPRQLVFAHAALAEPAQGRLRHDQRKTVLRRLHSVQARNPKLTTAEIDEVHRIFDS